MQDPPKGWRWTVRVATLARLRLVPWPAGDSTRRAGAFAAAVFLAAGLALGAQRTPEKTLPQPSYGIPNIVAVGMCLSVLAIACKHFKRTV